MTDPATVIQCAASDGFAAWMSQCGGSIIATTYQAGKVALIGFDGKQITFLARQFDKPMGLAVDGSTLALATRHDVTLFANGPELAPDLIEKEPGLYDALFLPRATFHTGDINAHDLAYARDGLWLSNTRFSCLARLSDRYSFQPAWKPPFVSQIAPEDRCHLNGLAVVDGRLRYVTCLGRTDAPGAWRGGKADGGIMMDVASNEIVLSNLCMPHSPRWYDNQIWLLNSGAGELLAIHPQTFQRAVVATLPGYLRGLCFVGPYALVGLCQIREKHLFGGLPIQSRVPKLLCGIALVDLRTGQQAGFFEFTAGCQELYDVQFLPTLRRPTLLNHSDPATRQAFTTPDFSYWLRKSNEVQS